MSTSDNNDTPSNSQSPPPPSDSSKSDSSPPPPSSDSSSSSSSGSSSSSPPPPSSDSSSSSPPPPSNSSPSPPPPSDNSSPSQDSSSSSSPPPPKSSDNSNSNSNSPPPPSNSSPPPPSGDDKKNNGGDSKDKNNNKNNDNNSNNSGNNNNDSSGNNNNNDNKNNGGSSSSSNDDNSSSNNNNNDGSSSSSNNNNNSPKSSTPSTPHAPPRSGSSNGNNWAPPQHAVPSGSNSKSLPSAGQNNSPSVDQRYIIAGGVAGGVLLFVIMLVVLCFCCKKKKRPNRDMNYYADNNRGNMTNEFYKPNQGNWNNNNGGLSTMGAPHNSSQMSTEQWMAAPPPPPPMMSSSEMSSAGFSGPHGAPLPPPHPAVALGFNQSSFTYNDLAAATGNFAQSNLLGQGGFGYVHKGVLPNGKEIAVKSLKSNSGQGEREFQAEVDIISRVHHRHLVSLVGYCIAGAQRMLVYEFVPNGTLEFHLHGAGQPTMDWPTRLKIAMGSAKGFAYLHEDCHPRIIHRDIKAANILLDENSEAKVADFGLAKLNEDTQTHVSTRIMGTFGYLAPEYASSGKLTEKSDVYSYGVMLLELITGRRPIDIRRDDDEDTLVDWARPILVQVIEGGSYEQLVDPQLGDDYDHQEMLRMVTCAAASVRQSARRRPKMSQIVRALEGDVSLDALHEGVKPGHSAMFGSHSGSENDMKRFRSQAGMSSTEFTSSELGTGEFSHSSGATPGNRI